MRLAHRPKFCPTHPTYRITRQPRGRCRTCWKAWHLKRDLYKALRDAVENVSRLFGPTAIEVRASWKGGKGDTKAISLREVPR